MTSHTIAQLGAWAGMTLLLGFAAVVIVKIFTGSVSLTGLLDSVDGRGRRVFSAARLQMMLMTLYVAVEYLRAVAANPQVNSLPTIPDWMLAGLGGSHALYLGGKTYAMVIRPLLSGSK